MKLPEYPHRRTTPRKDTLLNELRALLVNYTPDERVTMFDMINEGYCRDCGRELPLGAFCHCENDE